MTTRRLSECVLALLGVAALISILVCVMRQVLPQESTGDDILVDRLLTRLDSSRAQEARASFRKLGARVIPQLINRARQDPEARPAVIDALVTLGPASLPALNTVLGDDSDDLRLLSLHAVSAMARTLGEQAKPLMPRISHLLLDSNCQVRFAAAHALTRYARYARPAVPDLIALLETHYSETEPTSPAAQAKACAVLGKLGPAAGGAVPALRRRLGPKEPAVLRRAAVSAIWCITQRRDLVLPEVRELLNAPDADTRIIATRLLQQISPMGT